MGLFSKGSKTAAKVAVGAATAATSLFGNTNNIQQHVQSHKVQSHRTMNPVSRSSRPSSAHVRKK